MRNRYLNVVPKPRMTPSRKRLNPLGPVWIRFIWHRLLPFSNKLLLRAGTRTWLLSGWAKPKRPLCYSASLPHWKSQLAISDERNPNILGMIEKRKIYFYHCTTFELKLKVFLSKDLFQSKLILLHQSCYNRKFLVSYCSRVASTFHLLAFQNKMISSFSLSIKLVEKSTVNRPAKL